MNKPKNESGFGSIAVLLIVLVIAIIGIIGFYIYHRNHTSNRNPSAITSSKSTSKGSNQTSSTSNLNSCDQTGQASSLVIKEWAVTLTTPGCMGKVSYTMSTSGNELTFSSDLQKSLPASCSFATQASGPWGMNRFNSSTVDPSQKAALTNLGSYYYQLVYPQEGCNDSASAMQKLDSAYHTMFSSIEIY